MTEPKPIDRKAKHRTLNKAGFVHASGWLDKRDQAKFQEMVAWSREAVEAASLGLPEVKANANAKARAIAQRSLG